jgi:hypothetical protein
VDVGAVASESFIYRIIDDFEDKVMKSSFCRISNVHTWSLAHRFETFKDFDLARSVVLIEHAPLKKMIFIKLLFFPDWTDL